MELLEGDALRRRMLESYSRNPKGWSFVISPSKSGFFDAIASGPDGGWMLKIDSIFKPAPIVLGSQAEVDPRLKAEGPISYGYRKLPTELMIQLLEGEGDSGRVGPGLASLLRSEPVVPEAGGGYAHGPFLLTGPRKVNLSEGQRAIDSKLSAEMRRLMKSRYPAYG